MLAAYIDGEGCIDIHKGEPKKHLRPTPNLYLRVSVHNNDVRLIKWCIDRFGGSCITTKAGKSRPRDIYAWSLGSRQAANVIKGCLPFFIIKREQAEVALAFIETIGQHGKPIGLGVIDARLKLKSKLSDLKSVSGAPIASILIN